MLEKIKKKFHNNSLKIVFHNKSFVHILVLSFLVIFFTINSAYCVIYNFSPIFSIGNGTKETEVSWNVIDDSIPYGFLQGPSSFLTMSNGNIIIADSLNYRLLIYSSKGLFFRKIDLSNILKDSKLKYPPLIIHMAITNKNNLYLADAANNRVLFISLKGELLRIIGKTGNKSGEFQQINKVHTDDKENLYIEDLSLQRTILFNSKGKFIRNYNGLTSIIVDKFGNIVTLKYIEPFKREIVIYSNNGIKSEIPGFIEDNKPIKYISLLGYDKKNNLWITYDIDSFRIYIKFNILKNIQYKKRCPLFDVGIDVTTPDWISRNGEIFSIKVDTKKFNFYHLEMNKNLRIK